MCHKSQAYLFKHGMGLRRERGFLIPLAAILLVGIATLAIAISRFSGQVGTIVFQEGISTQAYYAADSGAQYAMNRLFLNPSPLARAATDALCTGLDSSTLNFATPGLNNCTAVINCGFTNDASDTTSYYTITSAAQCGAGELLSQRTIELGAFSR